MTSTTFARQPLQRALLFCCGLGLACASLVAKAEKPVSDTPQDYSHSMLLDLGGKSGVMAVRLPQGLYLHARSADLADLRLFDSEGKKVAFALHQPTLTDKTETFALNSKIFPLHSASDATSNSVGAEFELDVTRNAQGVLTAAKIRSKGSNASAANSLKALLLDFGLQNKTELPLIDHLQVQLPAG
ncbi:MAG: DUF3999 family protein, partial [Burkholderiales bacterium]|nr:DUF3999 family protein [Burkholderiales bacterium]